MKRIQTFLAITLIIFLGLIGLLWLKTKHTPTADEAIINGIIRTAGLSPQEKAAFNLTADFQLTNLTGNNQPEGYYLESPLPVGDHLGQCVKISGQVKPDWEGIQNNNLVINQQTTYERGAFLATKIEQIPYPDCNFETFPIRPETQMSTITLIGTLEHSTRPAPDIGYDYRLVLEEIFPDPIDPDIKPGGYQEIDIIPNGLKISTIESLIGKKVSVKGSFEWGYAETRFFNATQISPVDEP